MSDVVSADTVVDRCRAVAQEIADTDDRVQGVYLFGSHAKGEATAASDVDLAVLFEGDVPLKELLGLEDLAERQLFLPVQLIDAGHASPYLALDIVRGERLYNRDERRCDEFDLYVLRRAADLAPFERQRRAMLLGESVEWTDTSDDWLTSKPLSARDDPVSGERAK